MGITPLAGTPDTVKFLFVLRIGWPGECTDSRHTEWIFSYLFLELDNCTCVQITEVSRVLL